MMDGIYLVISAVIGAGATIASVLLSRNFKKTTARDPILSETQNNENIYTALQFITKEMGADRAYILQFHNGGHYTSGRSQQKFSCTHEITEPGISKEFDFSQNHIVSNFHDYIGELISMGKFAHTNYEDISDNMFSALMRNKGIKSIYNVPIKTLNGKVIGILGVDYIKECAEQSKVCFCKTKQKEKFNKNSEEFMVRQARVISGYLI